MNINTVIVDDEWLARKRLEKLLESYQDIQVLASCRDGQEAIDAIHKIEPDLVFLDIQMPDLDGFEVIKKIKPRRFPCIVFTTAFDHYAIKAFEYNAIDYLLKPFDEERLDAALVRVRTQVQLQISSKLQEKLQHLLLEFQQQTSISTQVFTISDKGKNLHIPVENIYFFKSEGNYVAIHTENAKFLYRTTMSELEKQLSPESFLRIHRSYIINFRYLNAYKYLNNNEYSFTLKNDKTLRSGKAYKETIAKFLSTWH